MNLDFPPCGTKAGGIATGHEAGMGERDPGINLDNVVGTDNYVLGPSGACEVVVDSRPVAG